MFYKIRGSVVAEWVVNLPTPVFYMYPLNPISFKVITVRKDCCISRVMMPTIRSLFAFIVITAKWKFPFNPFADFKNRKEYSFFYNWFHVVFLIWITQNYSIHDYESSTFFKFSCSYGYKVLKTKRKNLVHPPVQNNINLVYPCTHIARI